MKAMILPRILVISNNSFSKTEANGRTLGNFFINYPKENIAQFSLHAQNPDITICDNYFVVSDKQALKCFIKRVESVNEYKQNSNISIQQKNKERSKITRSPFSMLVRNFIWNSNCWKGENFNKWVKNFKPDIILLQAGDFPFMYNLAYFLADEMKIPLLMYNSESYYFKNFCYFKNCYSKWLYPFFRYVLKKTFEKFMKRVSGVIYISEALQNLYKESFKHKSIVLMTTSSIVKNFKFKSLNKNPRIVYLGNLGLNRYKNLICIAEQIQKINSDWKVEIYGNPPLCVEKELKSCSAIILKGFVQYNKVIDILQSSDLLLHTEYSDNFYTKDLQYAFSTKIADCLSSGTPFFVYAPDSFSFVKYLKENKAAFIATTKEELKHVLVEALLNEEKRKIQICNAIELAKKNHDINKNAVIFENFIKEIYENTSN